MRVGLRKSLAWMLVLGGALAGGGATSQEPPQTLEDIYRDTGNTFQTAIGFRVGEGTPTNQANPSYGLAIDDVVVQWREYTLEEDLTDCDSGGSCAIVQLPEIVYVVPGVLPIAVVETTPSLENDCDLDDVLDGTDDCNGNGIPDVVVRVSSQAESPGEIWFLDRAEPEGILYEGQISVSLGNSPGVLFVQNVGNQNPVVTATYFDADDGTGSPCPGDVDPAKHGLVRDSTAIRLGAICDVSIFDVQITDNGDGDIFVDTGETVDMRISYRNACGINLHNCSARIFGTGTEVDCILDSVIDLGDISVDGGTLLSDEAFRWKLRDDVQRSSVDEDLTTTFNVTVQCDELDALQFPQSVTLPLDIDIELGGQVPVAWVEGFESGTLGLFEFENLDAGIPGANNAEGHVNGDGWRCQYSDPSWPNSNSYGDDTKLDCFPGKTLAQADAVFWQPDGPGLTSCDAGRAKSGSYSMYYGICFEEGVDEFTTPISVVESVRTTDPINLGVGSEGATGTELQLSWWQQISLVDGTVLGITDLRSADAAVVQAKTIDAAGNDTSFWKTVTPFQNSYDAQRYDFFFSCMFDPIDDGNDEDSFFDPTDPGRREGPSSTCFPAPVYTRLGDTDELFNPENIGRATTPPAYADAPDLGLGTWIESKVDLTEYRGRRIKLRFLATSIKFSADVWEGTVYTDFKKGVDDGWWIDDVRIDQTLTDPVTTLIDSKVLQGCSGDPRIGCLVDQDCIDSGTTGPCDQPTPACGETCTSIDIAVSTAPDENGGAQTETLPAPGVAIELDASDSSGICIDGALQFRYSIEDGPDLRGWSEDPVITQAPLEDTAYLVEVRCTTDTSCQASTVVDVDVTCPTSGNLQNPFPETILADAGKTGWSWIAALDYDLFTGDLSAVSTYTGSLISGSGNSFTDATIPPSDTGVFYVLRESGEFCNTRGLWTSNGPAESPLRESTLP